MFFLKMLPMIAQGMILAKTGYGVTTWQWWAIMILTAIAEILYALDD